jgi:hypothetical protein
MSVFHVFLVILARNHNVTLLVDEISDVTQKHSIFMCVVKCIEFVLKSDETCF